MPSEKKRKRAGRDRDAKIHPRNRYADKPPDFSLLASLYPSFSSFVFYSPRDGLPRIDWTDFNATRELTRVLLLHDHGLNWWIPDGQLCPTVPNRSNYIHWIEDLLASDIIPNTSLDRNKVRGFDIGTGTNCIYPLLGASLLGWSFVGSDVTPVALEWAEKNVKSNPEISHLIEIRKADRAEAVEEADDVSGSRKEVNTQNNPNISDSAETWMSVESSAHDTELTLDGVENPDVGDKVEFGDVESEGLEREPSSNDHEDVGKRYNGPPVLLGVVKDGEKFDFCMCNPPFFENMEESGQNLKTACGGTAQEMVCNGGERAFISRIIDDSVVLKQSFRWYTSMVGKKSNLKFLIAKLRREGATIVKTTEFVQGRTFRWGLAWSFVAPSIKLVPSHAAQKNNMSFMLEGLPRQVGAYNVLQSIESFFCSFGASGNLNPSSFTVDVNLSNHHCNAILNNKADDVTNSIQRTDELSSCLPDSMDQLSFRVWVFQQIPGSLLVKGSLQQRNSPVLGMFSVVFRSLEDFIRCEFCKEKTLMNQNRTR